LYQDEEMGLLVGGEMGQRTCLEGLDQAGDEMAGKSFLVRPERRQIDSLLWRELNLLLSLFGAIEQQSIPLLMCRALPMTLN
jgi:hypothetical protein